MITKGLDNANVPDDAIGRAHAKWERLYRELSDSIPERFRPYLEESPIGNPRTLAVDGIAVTQSSVEYAYMLIHLEPYLRDVEVVVDIGGGYGGMARLLKLAFPELGLVLLDLPEVNAIQTYFLTRAFPETSVLTLSDIVERARIDPRELGADFLVLPGQLVERLEPYSFDLVINSRSMMEMDLETVTFYLSQIQSKLPAGGRFYCLNRYEKKTRLKDYPFDDRWYVSYSEPWPAIIDQNPHHELVGVRTPFPVVDGLKEHVAGFPPHDGFLDRLRAGWR